MKKILTIFLAMMLVMVGIVSAAVNITSPVPGQNISGTFLVTWDNPLPVSGLYLHYKQTSDCSEVNDWTSIAGPYSSSSGSYPWDTATEASEGQGCLRLILGSEVYNTTGPFIVDNIKPNPIIVRTGSLIVGETLTFNASDSTDSGTGIETYDWFFDDGPIDSGVEITRNFTSAGTYNVQLTVTDYAGNFNSTTLQINIADISFDQSFAYEAGILNISNLSETFDTGIASVTCNIVSSNPGVSIENSGRNCTLSWNNIPYSNRGVNDISIKATNSTETKYFGVSITVYTWMIDLEEGWNLISFPMIPTNENGDINTSVGNVIISRIYNSLPGGTEYVIMRYDAMTGAWDKVRRTGYGELSTIVPGYAYWVKVNQDIVLKGYGVKTDTWQMPPSVELGRNWNLIGKYGLTSVQKQNESQNLLLDSGALGNLADYPIMYNGDFLSSIDTLDYFEGYWTLIPGDVDGSIAYTISEADYNY